LNIPFTELKANMTGPSGMSLGQAIQSAKAGSATTTTVRAATVETQVQRAETETNEDFRVAGNGHRR
jgi:hypothetical protein